MLLKDGWAGDLLQRLHVDDLGLQMLLPNGSDGVESACNAGDLDSIPWLPGFQRRPWFRGMDLLRVSVDHQVSLQPDERR